MPTTTTNYGFYKPLVNDPTDQDLWGGYLNTDMDSIDGLIKTAIDWTASSKTANFSVTAPTTGSTSTGDAKKFFVCDATSGAITVSLPAAASAGSGFSVAFKKTDASANAVILDGNGSETIDGATTLSIGTQNNAVMIVCDGSNWKALSDNVNLSAYATLASPAFTGNPTAPTQTAGNNTTRLATTAFVTTAVAAAPNPVKMWVNFDGTLSSPITPRGSLNVTSVIKNSTGDYTINFTTNMADTNYAYFINYDNGSGSFNYQGSQASKTVSSIRVQTYNAAGASADRTQVSVMIVGN